jgi:hypothetical protein
MLLMTTVLEFSLRQLHVILLQMANPLALVMAIRQ